MKKTAKRCICLLLALCMCFGLYVPSLAAEPEIVEIAVTNEQDILEFFHSDAFDTHASYRFVYPDSPVMARIRCSNCGYNTLVGKTVEEYDLCHPSSQGRIIGCPDYPAAPDHFYVLLTYGYQYCNTCGYTSTKTFVESKYYIDCTFHETSYVATNYKTEHRTGNSTHEWKDTWSLYYNDPHA